MSILHTLRSRRSLAGGVALAAGAATVAAPAVAPPLAANPLDGDAELSPSVNGDSGTYESCTAMFGLTDKEDANFVTFDVTGAASPLPAIGEGLLPVLLIDIGEGVEECTPEIGFSDPVGWAAYLQAPDEPELVEAVVPFGGSPGYLVPKFASPDMELVGSVAPAIPAAALSLRVEATDPTLTVTVDPTAIAYPETPDLLDAITFIVEGLGGPESQLGSRYLEIVENPGGCNDASAIDIALSEAVIDLTNTPAILWEGETPCSAIEFGTIIVVSQLQVAALGLPATVTVEGVTPDPGPAPAPTPGPEPVTPKYTG